VKLLGSPDFVFPIKRVAVFVDGCFWHGCPKCYRRPKSSRKYWDAKAARNKARDKAVSAALRKGGWRVLRVWEHELKNPNNCIQRLKKQLANKRISAQSFRREHKSIKVSK